jgi:hypothetical protein
LDTQKKVNLENLNRWLSLAANIGVIGGIIFLAVEIGQNQESLDQANRLSLLDARTTEVEHWNQFRALLAENKELSDIWARGRRGESMDESDAARFDLLCTTNLWTGATMYERSIELGRLQNAEGTVNYQASRIATEPGTRKCWETYKELVRSYGISEFVSSVDAAVESIRQ